jgi:G3E family GTPase
MTVSVHLFSGFLGAGKTTAIRAQLGNFAGERVAIIVNDFGEAGLDEAALSEDEPFRITNIPGGCVCCTAPEGFVDALGAVLEGAPDRLIIEPTGLARPQDLIDTIRRCAHADALEMAPVVVLVDPGQLSRVENEDDPETRTLLREQSEVADILVANRCDLAPSEDLERFRKLAGELWPAPLAVVETEQGALERALLDWPEGAGPRRQADSHAGTHDHAHADVSHRARSWQWPPDAVFSARRLRAALERALAGEAGAPLSRLKGIFRSEEGCMRLEIAGGTLHETTSAFRRDSRVDGIVRAQDEAALDSLGEWLEAALLSEEERRVDTERIEIVLPDGRVHTTDRERLLALPEQVADVSTLIPSRQGSAARVSALFAELELPPTTSAVVVAGDGFASEAVPTEVLSQGVLLHSMDGAPLPKGKGGPFRLLIPDDASPEPIACANVKGVAKVVLR